MINYSYIVWCPLDTYLLTSTLHTTLSPQIQNTHYIKSGNCGRHVQMITVWTIARNINGVGKPGDREIFKWGTVKYTSPVIEGYSHIASPFWWTHTDQFTNVAPHNILIFTQQAGLTKLISAWAEPISIPVCYIQTFCNFGKINICVSSCDLTAYMGKIFERK